MVNHTKHLILLFIYCNYIKCEYLDLREGKKCVLKGVNGTCVNIFKCPKAQHDIISTKEYPPICAFDDKEPIVCCTNCYPYVNSDLRDEVFNPHIGLIRKSGSVAGDKFNEYLNKLEYPCKLHRKAYRTFRMDEMNNCWFYTDTSTGFSCEGVTYPRQPGLMHTAVLGYGEDLESAQWLCGGSIISENYILTTANCTSMKDLGPVKFVAMGPLNGTEPAEPWQRLRVKRAISHPDYRPSSKYHDIALLETETPIVFSNQVVPISVVPENAFRSWAIAWSQLGHGKGLTEILDSVSVNSLEGYNEVECSLFYPPQPELANGYNHTIQLCYGYKEKKPDIIFEGDKGASIQTTDSTTCAFALLGVTSVSRTCGEGGGSALYTRVPFYRPWIESIIWPTLSDSGEVNEAERLAALSWGFNITY